MEVDSHQHRDHGKSCSFIIFSLIAVTLYIANVVVTVVLFGYFVFVFIKTNSSREDNRCFLFSDLDQSTAICDSSIAGISFLILLEVILIFLGTASIVSGARNCCLKSLEISAVLLCMVLGTLMSLNIALGMNLQGNVCKNSNSVCDKYEYHLYISSWMMVIVFIMAFLFLLVDCMCNLSTRRRPPIRRYGEHWYDENMLLRDTSHARLTYS